VCYYLRLEKEIELKRIGYYFNRDHTTIMKAIQRCEDYLYFDNTKKEVKKTLKILRAHCGEL
jgi:chromosomal replication initiation ATPase DnaA